MSLKSVFQRVSRWFNGVSASKEEMAPISPKSEKEEGIEMADLNIKKEDVITIKLNFPTEGETLQENTTYIRADVVFKLAVCHAAAPAYFVGSLATGIVLFALGVTSLAALICAPVAVGITVGLCYGWWTYCCLCRGPYTGSEVVTVS